MAFMSGWFRNTFLPATTSAATGATALGLGTGDTVTHAAMTVTGTLTAGTVSPALSSFGGTQVLRIPDVRKDGAWLTAVDTTPGSSLLGLAATTAGVNLVGNQASGNTKSDYAQIHAILPAWYISGATITVRLRAKWSTTLLTVSSKVDCEVKVAADGSLGSDICTTAAQQVTTSFANYSFTVTPTGRVAGDALVIRVALLGDDTGGTVNTAGAISEIALVLGSS